MDEREFWECLEFRVCREMEGIAECLRRRLWCDGFLPEEYALDAAPRYMAGRVWIGSGGRRQEKWDFTFMLASSLVGRADISWPSLLPPDESVGWLVVDMEHKSLEMRP